MAVTSSDTGIDGLTESVLDTTTQECAMQHHCVIVSSDDDDLVEVVGFVDAPVVSSVGAKAPVLVVPRRRRLRGKQPFPLVCNALVEWCDDPALPGSASSRVDSGVTDVIDLSGSAL